jgi:hypothetical protein
MVRLASHAVHAAAPQALSSARFRCDANGADSAAAQRLLSCVAMEAQQQFHATMHVQRAVNVL